MASATAVAFLGCDPDGSPGASSDDEAEDGSGAGASIAKSIACRFRTPPSLAADVMCFDVPVPARREGGGSGTLTLHVARVRAEERADKEPLVLLSGGPGQPAEVWFGIVRALPFLRQSRDLIILDQRGVGASQPRLECTAEEAAADERFAAAEPTSAEVAAVYESCLRRHEQAGVDLAAFNTREAALDVDDVRRALGESKVSLFGVSYGARLALEVAKHAPSAVRSMLLDSVPDPARNPYVDVVADFDEVLTQVMQSCRGAGERVRALCASAVDPAKCLANLVPCDVRYVDVDGALDAGAQSLKTQPLTAKSADDAPFDEVDFAIQLTSILEREPGLAPYWASGVKAIIDTGNRDALGDKLRAIAKKYEMLEREDTAALDGGALIAYLCNAASSVPPTTPRPVRSALRGFASAVEEAFARLCARPVWLPADEQLTTVGGAGVRALLLAGTFDVRTPVSSAEAVAAKLERATLVKLEGLRHFALPQSTCARSIAEAFLADPDAELNVACAAKVTADIAVPSQGPLEPAYFANP